ncbi:MAG: hypothetical protein M3N42_17970, partial [Cyanobacteriota bacterium]|nr:hypothetical protein [Cyanobacteriota bacterium]
FNVRTAQSPNLANFGVINAFREVVHALRERNKADNAVAVALERIHRDEQRIAQCLGKPVRQLDILEIGGGQQMERARYFGINNQVTAIDLDVIPCGFDLGSYLRMFQENGFGRGENCWTQPATGRSGKTPRLGKSTRNYQLAHTYFYPRRYLPCNSQVGSLRSRSFLVNFRAFERA